MITKRQYSRRHCRRKNILLTKNITKSAEVHKRTNKITKSEEVVKGTDEVKKRNEKITKIRRLTKVLKNGNI